jgi:DNA helicase-2/ATP-dependent DNA helicase PcrA
MNDGETMIVICDGANTNARAALAQKLARKGFSTVEPIGCKDLYEAAGAIEEASGVGRVVAALAFASKCMSGTQKTSLERAVRSQGAVGRCGGARTGSALHYAHEVVRSNCFLAVDSMLAALQSRAGAHLFRREMLFAMRSALQIRGTLQGGSLPDAVWEVQNRIRHAGRRLPQRSVGSTLLVKGLECDRAVVVHAKNMSKKDWYVALTRATKGIRVIAPAMTFTPPR